jgi:hypothetical protein
VVNVLQREKRGDIFVFSARASGRFFFFGGDALFASNDNNNKRKQHANKPLTFLQ